MLASLVVVRHLIMPRDFLLPVAGPRVVYPFRFRDPATGNWVRTRYVAERRAIAARDAEWEIIGPPETRAGVGAAFSP